MRPKQWAKNVLLGAAPFAAGDLFSRAEIGAVCVAFASFSLIASGAYCINDVSDIERDQLHPKKRNRPVAAGLVPVGVASVVGIVAVAAGLAISLANGWKFVGVAGVYAMYTFLYTYVLKKIATVELVALAAGFVVRAVAGAIAVGAAVSSWFFICIYAGALLMASGKRTAELAHGAGTRAVLASYTPAFLDTVRTAAVSIALTSYALWVFEGPLSGSGAAQASLIPLTTAILRYGQIAASGGAGEPEEIVFHDRTLQLCGVLWAVILGGSLYIV